jgi:hypothetical protein
MELREAPVIFFNCLGSRRKILCLKYIMGERHDGQLSMITHTVVLKKIWETCSQCGHLTLSVVIIPFLLLRYSDPRQAAILRFCRHFPAVLALNSYFPILTRIKKEVK